MEITKAADFYEKMNDVNFSQNYWNFCHGFDLEDSPQRRLLYGVSTIGKTGVGGWGTHDDVINFFETEGEAFIYKKKDRSFNLTPIKAGNITLKPVYISERYGPYLAVNLDIETGEFLTDSGLFVGGDLAIIAFESRAHADPSFTENSYSPLAAPYPRPFPRNVKELQIVLKHFLELRDLIRAAVT